MTPRGSSRRILGAVSSPHAAGTQGEGGRPKLPAVTEGSLRARLAVSIFKTIPRGRNYFSRQVHLGQRAKAPYERHAGRCGFKPTLWLQSPRVQTYVIVVWGYHCGHSRLSCTRRGMGPPPAYAARI